MIGPALASSKSATTAGSSWLTEVRYFGPGTRLDQDCQISDVMVDLSFDEFWLCSG